MTLRHSLTIMLTLGLCAGWACCAPQVEVPILASEPALTGDLSSAVWEQAATFTDFVALTSGDPVEVQTTVRLLASDDALYIGVICHEPEMDKLMADLTGRDAQLWGDDAVDLMIAPSGGVFMYHFIVNPNGSLWDGLHGAANFGGDVDLEGIEVEAARGGDRWSAELRVPFAALGAIAQPGEVWGFNVGRERKAGRSEISSWAVTDSFTEVATLGAMRFTGPGAPEQFTSISRGGASAAFNEFGHNSFDVEVAAPAGRERSVTLTVSADGREIGTRDFSVSAGQQRRLSVPYMVPAEGQPTLRFAAVVDGAEVYATEISALPAASPKPRTWIVEDPLFRELLSDEPPGFAADGALMWTHMLNQRVLQATAVRFGVEYVYEDAYRLFADNALIPLGGSGEGVRGEYYDRFGIKYCAYVNESDEIPWIVDPTIVKDYLDRTEALLSAPHPHLWGLSAGDEREEYAIRQGMALMENPPEGYEYIHEANREVMERFGGGKWGIPEGEGDRNPYRRIAYFRWINEKMRERAAGLRALVDKYDPSLAIVGTDPVGGVHGYEFSRQAPYYDIFTHQYLPRGSQWRQYLGFLTKVLGDLTGKEVWPCVHVENYAFATTPAEALEEMSQVIRNGGHGFHLYMPDTANAGKTLGDTRVTLWGSPRRHETVMNIVRMTTRMPRPNYPQPGRVAVFYNDDCLQSEGYHAPGRTHWYRTEACYTFLGPIARSWFSFIDVPMVLDDTRPLIERFDVIWLPTATYQQPEVVDAFERFVRDGGTLICGDPTAFSTDVLGEDTSARRTALFGAQVGAKCEASTLSFTDGGTLTVPGAASVLQPAEGVHVLARYDDGSAAVTANELGEGVAILWGTNPFEFSANEDPAWQEWFTSFARQLGMPTGLDIWRFQYPQSAIWQAQPARGVCLTNNNVVWQEEVPHFPGNLATGGSYSYSIAPDAMPESVAEGAEIGFDEGNLTDRRASLNDAKKKPAGYELYVNPDSRWMVSWEQTDPVSVTFDLGARYAMSRLKLWYRDAMPGVTVEGSADGQAWTALGRGSGPLAEDRDVRELSVSLRHDLPVRYVRATFAERAEGQRLSLVEAEVWGREVE